MIQNSAQNTNKSQTQKELIRIITMTSSQHYHHRSPLGQILRESQKKSSPAPLQPAKPKKKQKRKKWWRKGLDCLINLFRCRRNYQEEEKIFVKCQNLLETLQRLRNSKEKDGVKYLPKHKKNQKTLVVDLEGTFVHSSRQKIQDYHFKFSFEADGTVVRMFSKIRPGAQLFFEEMSKLYEIIVFTSCEREQARAILGKLCKPGQVKHELCREKCLNLNQIYYLKEMSKLNRDPSRVVFIDCNVETGVLQPLNFHQISRYNGNGEDRQLHRLTSFLKWLEKKQVVTPIFKNYEAYLEEVMQFNKSYYDKEDSILEDQCLRQSLKLSHRASIADRVRKPSRFKEPKNTETQPYPLNSAKQEPLKIQLELSQSEKDLTQSIGTPPAKLRKEPVLPSMGPDVLRNHKKESDKHGRKNSEVQLLKKPENRPKQNNNDNSESLMIKQSVMFSEPF